MLELPARLLTTQPLSCHRDEHVRIANRAVATRLRERRLPSISLLGRYIGDCGLRLQARSAIGLVGAERPSATLAKRAAFALDDESGFSTQPDFEVPQVSYATLAGRMDLQSETAIDPIADVDRGILRNCLMAAPMLLQTFAFTNDLSCHSH